MASIVHVIRRLPFMHRTTSIASLPAPYSSRALSLSKTIRNEYIKSHGVIKRFVKTSTDVDINKKRVLGVIAHINSGKTTTSEAMLFASGALHRMGNVDLGDTTMDYLPAERERGITVASAAIMLGWRGHRIFLVDSPGHLDFTFEVERALRVMDAAIVVLDAVAGVQPQTETVWRQADANRLPRLIFINKMDRDSANFHSVVDDVRRCFGATPLVTHVPLFDGSRAVTVYDVLTRLPETEGDMMPPADPALSASQLAVVDSAADALVEACAELDDDIMTAWLDGRPISRQTVVSAVRAACVDGRAVPVLCGASLREIGVEPLLNAITSYLPSPLQRRSLRAFPMHNTSAESLQLNSDPDAPFLAYAFKVTHDKHRGRLVFMRVFCGQLSKRTTFLNTTTTMKEQPTRLLHVLADKFEDVDSISTGDIFAAVGMKHTATGDTIMVHGTPKHAQVVLDGVRAPPAVFAVAVEVDSSANERELEGALERLVDEDASLELRRDTDTGETLLAGMGELHLEVAIDHMQRKLPFDVRYSRPRVAYRERVIRPMFRDYVLDAVIGSTRLTAALHIEVAPCTDVAENAVGNIVIANENEFTADLAAAAREGATAALGRGPVVGAAITGARVVISPSQDANHIKCADASSMRACASRGVQAILREVEAVLLEPVMRVDAAVPEAAVGDVVAELTHPIRRRGFITDVTHAAEGSSQGRKLATVSAIVPVDGLIGWASTMRSITKGRGDLQMTFAEYRAVDRSTQMRIVEDAVR